MVPGPDCREDGQMCPNGMHHAARSVSAWRWDLISMRSLSQPVTLTT